MTGASGWQTSPRRRASRSREVGGAAVMTAAAAATAAGSASAAPHLKQSDRRHASRNDCTPSRRAGGHLPGPNGVSHRRLA